MNEDAIFLIQDEALTVLSPTPYETEDVLQQLLADHPEVLAGGTTSEGQVARLLLVRREMGVPTATRGPATFSVDHLFLDPDGVPVVVEVKRATDTRIRREVVGQMLDYAANGSKYWPVSDLQGLLQEKANKEQTTVEALLDELNPDVEPEKLWSSVEANLRAGRLRMVFVADHMPAELVRIIEFLNEQMSPAEVLGVEVLRYQAGTTAVYVPHLIGATSKAVDTKQGRERWNEETFLSEVQRRCPEYVASFQMLLDHVTAKGAKFSWGKSTSPGVSGWYRIGGGEPRPVWTTNTNSGGASPYIDFYMKTINEKVDAETLSAFVTDVSAIPGLKGQLPPYAERKVPNIRFSDVTSGDIKTFLDAVELLLVPPHLSGDASHDGT